MTDTGEHRALNEKGETFSGVPETMAADLEKRIELRTKFQKLAAEWRSGTEFCHLSTDIYGHSAYQAIVALGEAAVPFMLEELGRREMSQRSCST